MNAYDRIGSAVTKIATLTSVRRTRIDDAVRLDAHGGTVDDLTARVRKTATKYESVAEQMEAELS